MNRTNKILLVCLAFVIISTVLVTCFYHSYAYFTNTLEIHGKINMIAGTIDYNLESSSLSDNSITVEANTIKVITISITSLNTIGSTYEIYYNLDSDNDKVNIGYSETSSNPSAGTIESEETKEIEVVIRNDSDTSTTVTFGVIGGLLNNELELVEGISLNKVLSTVEIGTKWVFDYTGNEETFTVPVSGTYKLEVWGAQGGSASSSYIGGYGSYSIGYTELTKDDILYLNIGKQGATSSTVGTLLNGSYNGGGSGYGTGASGGGATHIATKSGLLSTLSTSTDNILIVAGGGGGSVKYGSSSPSGSGGNAGGFIGSTGKYGGWTTTAASGGTQTSGGNYGLCSDSTICGNIGSFGIGGGVYSCSATNCSNNYQAGGGGGYYGGGSARHAGGGGGSGYIGNSLLTDKVMYCYECEESEEEDTKTISTTNVSENPISNYAKMGNGYAKITYVGNTPYVEASTSSKKIVINTYNSSYYAITTSSDVPTNWNNGDITSYTATTPGTYYIHVKSNEGITNYTSVSIKESVFCDYSIGQTWVYDYIGEEQAFTVPTYCSGTYKLETWGAQGGGNDTLGGYGGYSIGNISLTYNQILYINVGSTTATGTGGYNGGGTNHLNVYGGGGATHVALKSGLLSTLENNKDSILIVSGGGGGYNTVGSNYGGSGGGITGCDGDGIDYGTGGTQSTGGKTNYTTSTTASTNLIEASFGLGASNSWNNEGLGAGGGGFYGGGAGGGYDSNASGGGGSGYIGNSLLTDKVMYCYSCTESEEESTKTISTTNVSETAISNYAKIGNGYAKITLISID